MRITGYTVYVKPSERMGKHYCNKCHTWFDNYYVREVEESRGEYWGIPCTETVYYEYCPNCHADVYDGDVYDNEDIIEEDEDEQDS